MTPNQREDMDKMLELEDRWHPLNRVEREDLFLKSIYWGSWIVGILAAICAVIEVAFHIWKALGR